MPEIYYEIPIQSSVEKCFEAMTSESLISQWWLNGVKFKPEVGAIGTFPFPDGNGQISMKVEESVPPHRQVWRCVEHKHSDWLGTLVVFDIVPESDGSCLLKLMLENSP